MDLVSQNLLLTSGGGKKSTYVDDVFSTYLYVGNNSTLEIDNGVDLAGEGGMVWVKNRESTDSGAYHQIFDTARGRKGIFPNDWRSQVNYETGQFANTAIKTFDSDGFTLGSAYYFMNVSGEDHASWTFRKAPGFFDVVNYTGNGVRGRQIAHSLGCQPGLILIKFLGGNQHWCVYHKSEGATEYANLDNTNAFGTAYVMRFNDTEPTATHFTVGEDNEVNGSSGEYIAYLFASEGTSTAATARSVYYPAASGNGVRTDPSNDFMISNNDFTLEGYFYYTNITNGYQVLFDTRISSSTEICLIAGKQPDGKVYIENGPDGYGGTTIIRTAQPEITEVNKWYHIAFSKHNGNLKLFINGVEKGSNSSSVSFGGNNFQIGNAHQQSGNYAVQGYISNVRFINQQGIYTSNFTPSTEPLTTTSQGATASKVKLLCFQNTTVNGTTVNASGGWVSNVGTPVVSTFSPFLDAASPSNEFGEDGDQNIIKCGSYVGNGSSDGPNINLGWEPQWILIKRSSGAESWMMFDAMRGMTTQAGNDHDLRADLSNSEGNVRDYIDITPTGFKQVNTQLMMNGNNDTYIYCAIRRPDGYVGKPAKVGTDVFNQAYGNYSSGNNPIPNFTAGFPVDFAWAKSYGGSGDWWTSARLVQSKEVQVNTNIAMQSGSNKVFDSNVGWHNNNGYDWYISHMWKRHAGFDVQTYTGTNHNTERSHGLGKVPEMMWVKRRDASSDWAVYHKDLHQYPQDYYLVLNSSAAVVNASQWWKQPTSTHWFTAIGNLNNINGATYIAMLFASVAGISKVGYYTGNGSTTGPTITTGFTPRFLIVKNASWSHGDWFVYDTTRGWASGNDKTMKLNSTAAQLDNSTWDIDPTSTGFTVQSNDGAVNANGNNFIYYAHA